jgi:hypothetical protein
MADPAYAVNPNYPYKGKDKTFLQQIVESRKMKSFRRPDRQPGNDRRHLPMTPLLCR